MAGIDHEALVAMLDRLKLTAIRDQLDTLLDEAARSEMTLREALAFFVGREIARRDERRISHGQQARPVPLRARARRLRVRRAALAGPAADPGAGDTAAGSPMATRLLLLGPPGTGKTHLAVALGREAIRQNYSVQFVTAATLVAMLAKAHDDGSARQATDAAGAGRSC